MEEVKLKITIDGKEAGATLNLTEDNLKDVVRLLGKVKTDSKTSSDSMRDGFNSARMVLIGIRETYSAMLNIFAKPIQAAAQFQGFTTQFEVLLKSADAAEARMKELSDFAAKTPFQLPEIVKASTTLQVLTKGALATGDGLRMVGDTAAGTGANVEELAVTMGRLYDGIANNRPVGEALMRMQELGAISGDVRAKLEQLQKTNRLSAEGWALVTQEMEKFSGMMEKQSATLGGKLSNLEDNFGKLQVAAGGMVALGLSPVLEHLSKLIEMMFDISPAGTAAAGTIGMLTSAYMTLRIAGIVPATFSLRTFIASLYTLKGAMIGTGVLGIVVAFGFGLNKLMEAWENMNKKQEGAEDSMKKWQKTLMQTKYMMADKSVLKDALSEYEAMLASQKQLGLTETKDPDDFNNLISGEEYIKRLQARVDALKEMIGEEAKAAQLSKEEKEKLFKAEREFSQDLYEHQQKMADIRGGGLHEEYMLTKDHLEQMVRIYTKYGMDTKELQYRILENETAYIQAVKNLRLELKQEENANLAKIVDSNKPDDVLLPDAEYMTAEQIARVKIDAIDLEWERKRALADWEFNNELERYKNFENFAEIRQALEQRHAETVKGLAVEKGSAERMQAAETFGVISGIFNRMTVAGKAAAIAQATINIYEGATKALAQTGILGIFSMGAVIASGFETIRNIFNVGIPKMAKGGIVDQPTLALIGEAGPEAVLPLSHPRASAALGGGKTEHILERVLNAIERMPLRLEMRLKHGELYGAVEQANYWAKKASRG